MTALHAWNTIIHKIEEKKRIELPTVPKTKKVPVWFSVTTDGKTIFIDEATEHKPSSKLSVQRKLHYNTFQKVFPLYLRRENGEQVSSEATAITLDQVYYYSIIKHLGQ